jgi:hypothetical protein
MKTTKTTQAKNKNNTDNMSLLKKVVIVVLVLVAGIALLQRFQELNKYKILSQSSNQACVGLGISLENGANLSPFKFDAQSMARSGEWGEVGQHKCNTGVVVTKYTQNGYGSSETEGYELGANVIYFKDAKAAYKYADKVHNPTRYWSIDEEGEKQNIPQTSLFTFIVNDVKEPYFDSYTVRDKALVTLSLPCNMDKKRILMPAKLMRKKS